MTSDDEWLKERVKYVGGLCLTQDRVVDVEDLLAFGREAIERGKAQQDKAVAAERERCARIADDAAAMREQLFNENGASINASKAVQAEEIAKAIRRGDTYD